MIKLKKTTIFILLSVFGLILIYNVFTPMYADDFSYSYSFADGTKITSIFDIFPSMYAHYYSLNGRLVTHFLSQLFLFMGKDVFNVINSFAFLLLGVIIYMHVYGNIKDIKNKQLAIIYIFLFLFIPDFGQSILWIDGCANYLYGTMIALAFLIPFRMELDEQPVKSRKKLTKVIISTILMLIFGLLAGDSLENLGVCVVFMSFVYIIYRLIKYKNVQIWAVSGFVGSLVGCVFMLISPGTHKRSEGVSFSVSEIFNRAYRYTFQLKDDMSIFLTIICLLLIFYIALNLDSKKSLMMIIKESKMIIIYIVMFMVSFYSLSVAPWFALRVESTLTSVLIIIALSFYEKCHSFKERFPASLLKVIFSFLIVIVLFTYIFNFFCTNGVLSVYSQAKSRENLILEAKNKGQEYVYLPKILSGNQYVCYRSDGEITEKFSEWPNVAIAKYYDIDRVYLKED